MMDAGLGNAVQGAGLTLHLRWQLLQAEPTCCASGVQADDAATGSLSLYQSGMTVSRPATLV